MSESLGIALQLRLVTLISFCDAGAQFNQMQAELEQYRRTVVVAKTEQQHLPVQAVVRTQCMLVLQNPRTRWGNHRFWL